MKREFEDIEIIREDQMHVYGRYKSGGADHEAGDLVMLPKNVLARVLDWIEDMIGFSEPDKGPLSRFHTYGPDMMKLLAQGIRDNVGLVQDAIGDVAGVLSTTVQGAGSTSNNYTYGPMSINVYGAQGQDVNELARIVENKINAGLNRKGAVFR